MSRPYLLDVNLLLALADPAHLHHDEAHGWFGSVPDLIWATCPITENGFIRVAGHPKYPNSPGESSVAADLLRRMCSSRNHVFWADSISIRDALPPGLVYNHKLVTDLYLLALACKMGGQLATFDRGIPARLLRGGPEALELIGGKP